MLSSARLFWGAEVCRSTGQPRSWGNGLRCYAIWEETPHPGLTERFVLWLCTTLVPKEEPRKRPQRLAVTTPAHRMQSFGCHHTTSITAFPWDTVASSNSAGKVGGLLCFLQPLRFWDDPCFSTSSILANLPSGNENFQCKRLQSTRCTVDRREKNLLL